MKCLYSSFILFYLESSEKNHVIIMLIDALRSGYVFNKNDSYYLKTIEKLEQQGKAFSVKLRTHTPTVTLPRLKVMIQVQY
jgi:predicted AlkP superfamily pyrophosphatase or phosphodiesterase